MHKFHTAARIAAGHTLVLIKRVTGEPHTVELSAPLWRAVTEAVSEDGVRCWARGAVVDAHARNRNQ
jgi:hypothetical protein